MLLANNQPIGHFDISKQISILKNLPSGFDSFPEQFPSLHASKACSFFSDFGETAIIKWNENTDDNGSLLSLAQKSFRMAMAEATQKDNKDSWGMLAARYGDIFLAKNQFDDFLSSYKEALTVLKENQNQFYAYHLNGVFYSRLHQLRKTDQTCRENTEIDLLMQGLCVENSKTQGQFIKDQDDAEAYMVHQTEVGFSDQQRMGTNNVWTCVTVLVHDTLSKKTALAHMDASTKGETLEVIFDRMPRKATAENPFQVRLMGARNLDSEDQISYDTSHANLKKILEFFDKKHVNILSADIGSLELPDALTVDPQSFTIKAAYPKDKRVESVAYHEVGRKNNQLYIAFDLTESPLTAPILLKEIEIIYLRNITFKRSHEDLFTQYRNEWGYSAKQALSSIGIIGAIKYAYYKALAPLIKAHADHVCMLKEEGFHISNTEITKGRNLLGKLPLHIGANADIANAPALDFIKSDFHHIGDFNNVSVSTKAIHDFSYPICPYQNVRNPRRIIPPSFYDSSIPQNLILGGIMEQKLMQSREMQRRLETERFPKRRDFYSSPNHFATFDKR